MKLSMLATLFLSLFFVALVRGDNDREVVKVGTCTGGTFTKSKLELSQDDDKLNTLEVEFDLDSNRPNRVWTVTISRSGNQVYKRNHRTNRYGNFEVELDLSGGLAGNITAVAARVSSSERCTAQARFA